MKKLYYTIGEVSDLLDVKQHVLRYWESEFNQLRPKKDKNRNRQYTVDHITLLQRIKNLLYIERLTIEGAKKKLSQMSKQTDQFEFDFTNDKDLIKEAIIAELTNLRNLLLKFKDKENV